VTWNRRLCSRLAALFLLAAALPAASNAATLTRYPWVNLVTTYSALIAWQTDVPTDSSKVHYSTDTVTWQTQAEYVTTADHAVTLSGLNPDLTYFYRVVSGTDTLTTGDDYFNTAPFTGLSFSFLAFGDIGQATADQMAVAAQIDPLLSSFAILTGDIIYNAGEAANFTPQYFDIYRPTLSRIPFYTALGNHDIATANGQPYLDAFYLPSNNPAATERYYSFDYSNAHFVCLEVVAENTTPSAAMLTWLDQDLSASFKRWKFVFFHVPAYSNSGGHGGDATIAAALEPIFLVRGVDAVFQGHNHFYTRTYPLDGGVPVNTGDEPDYINPSGPVWITTGGGGRALYAIAAPTSIEAYAASVYHFVYASINDNVLTLTAIDKDGVAFDTSTITKTDATDVRAPGSGPARFALGSARPNPTRGMTNLSFTLDRAAPTRVMIVDVAGRLVRTLVSRSLQAGPHAASWDGRDERGRDAPAGIYFAVVRSGERRATSRIALLR